MIYYRIYRCRRFFYWRSTHLEKNKDKWRVRPTFQIKLDIRDLSLLENIKVYFNDVGSINIYNQECVYKVRSLKEVDIIVKHFDQYTLITKKKADFELFKLIINKLNNKEHLTSEGLQEIISICVSMNLGLSSVIKKNFSHIIPVARPLIENMVVPHPEWVAGFVSGEGSFSIHVGSQPEDKSVSLSFRVSQHSKDEQLLKSFVDYFGCGNFNYHNKEKKAVIFVVRKFVDINSKIIPFFEKYKVLGVKNKDFLDWIEAAKVIESKNHLTPSAPGLSRWRGRGAEGYKRIYKIKENMNSYRV